MVVFYQTHSPAVEATLDPGEKEALLEALASDQADEAAGIGYTEEDIATMVKELLVK